MENNQLKINYNEDNKLLLMYDNPKTGNNHYGEWFMYGVKKDGHNMSLFATPTLHKILKNFRAGDEINVRKEETDGGKTKWDVKPINTAPLTDTKTPVQTKPYIDDRTHDIHKQVCLKLAVQMMGDINSVLSDSEVTIVKANTQLLLSVLEGDDNEADAPF